MPINVRLSSSNVTAFKLNNVPVAKPLAPAIGTSQAGPPTPGKTSRRVTDEPLPVHRIARLKLACDPTKGKKSPVAPVTDNGPCGKFWPLKSSSLITPPLIPLLLIPLLLSPLLSVMVPLPVNTVCPLTLPSTIIASTCCGAINATVANATRTDNRNFDIFIVSSLRSFCRKLLHTCVPIILPASSIRVSKSSPIRPRPRQRTNNSTQPAPAHTSPDSCV